MKLRRPVTEIKKKSKQKLIPSPYKIRTVTVVIRCIKRILKPVFHYRLFAFQILFELWILTRISQNGKVKKNTKSYS